MNTAHDHCLLSLTFLNFKSCPLCGLAVILNVNLMMLSKTASVKCEKTWNSSYDYWIIVPIRCHGFANLSICYSPGIPSFDTTSFVYLKIRQCDMTALVVLHHYSFYIISHSSTSVSFHSLNAIHVLPSRQWTSFLSGSSISAYAYMYSIYYFFFKTK